MRELPQIVPSSRCLQCDVCCRFPDADSPLRPYFTRDEIQKGIAAGLPASVFPDPDGGKIRLMKHPDGEGHVCPAFDVATNHCRIYSARPLDCRLYPFAVMRDPQGTGTVLGWDRKCPYLREESDPRLPLSVSRDVTEALEQNGFDSVLNRDPGLIGAFQEDVWVMAPLPSVAVPAVPSPPSAPGLEPLTGANVPDFPRRTDRERASRLSYTHPVSLFMWESLMRFFRAEIKEGPLIVAEQGGAYFLPVPPFTDDPVPAARHALDLLDRLNRDPSASRIERLDESQMQSLSDGGLHVEKAGEEYLYRRSDLAALSGRRHKPHRWNCNLARRRYRPEIRPWAAGDLPEAMNLYGMWRSRKEGRERDRYAAALMEDSFYAHWKILSNADRWGVRARVAEVNGGIRAYTAGLPIGAGTFLILLEIADPAFPGLGPYLFREFCRELDGFDWINTMDDSGLESIRKTKLAYGPEFRIPFFTAARNRTGSIELPLGSLGGRGR